MSVEGLPEDILQLIKPQQVRSYALAKGWKRVPGVNGEIALFSHPRGQWDQLIVPMDESFDDYSRRLRDIVEILARFESRPDVEILNDLITPDSDIIRYRVASPVTGRGSIPLMEGIRLLEGAKRSIMAAACSVVNPVTHHPRMSRSEAQQLINACHLGQSERGSYAVSVSCPLRAVEPDQPSLPGTEPFTRRPVSTLMRSVFRVVRAIEADMIPQVFQLAPDEPVLSANLCDALLLMQPHAEDSYLDVKASLGHDVTRARFDPLCRANQTRVFPDHRGHFEDASARTGAGGVPVRRIYRQPRRRTRGRRSDAGRGHSLGHGRRANATRAGRLDSRLLANRPCRPGGARNREIQGHLASRDAGASDHRNHRVRSRRIANRPCAPQNRRWPLVKLALDKQIDDII